MLSIAFKLTLLFLFLIYFKPLSNGKKKILIAVLVSVLVFIFTILGLIFWKCYFGQRTSSEQGNVNL